jgi:hypothetical protein
MIDLADAQAILEAAKSLVAERKSYERISERARSNNLSSKQAQKANADLNWQAMAVIKAEDRLHAACVDGDVADLRPIAAYASRELRPSGWHTYSYTPPRPRSYREERAAA